MRTTARATLMALILAAAAAAAMAQQPATLLLRSGSRVSGELVDMGGSGFEVRVNGETRRIAIGEVAVIDFGGDATQLPRAEAAMTANGPHVLVLRSGQRITGTLEDMGGTTPLRISFNSGGGLANYQSSQVQRIYLASPPESSLTGAAAGTLAEPAAPTDADPTVGTTVEVSARVQWTSTGVRVLQGQTVQFTSRGQIRLSNDSEDMSGPAGREGRRAASAPLPNDLAGALIGRIGSNGQPFGIGDQKSIAAPGTGELFLGINDDHVADNAGAYRVTVLTTAMRRQRR